MKRISTDNWKPFVIGDIFEKNTLKCVNPNFTKALDTSEYKTEEFNLPLVNAKNDNNGIMYWGRMCDFESEEMCLDVVQNGASSTGNVYAQPQRTGVLWDAYLIKPRTTVSVRCLLFLAVVLQKILKQEFCYENKAIWDKVSVTSVDLPATAAGMPDWGYMDSLIQKAEHSAIRRLSFINEYLRRKKKRCVTAGWGDFNICELFDIKKPAVYHTSDVCEYSDGINYVVRSKFNNGVKYRVVKTDKIVTNPAGVISFGSENSTFFYQPEEWCSGRDIYYIDTRGLSRYACIFLAACLQPIAAYYSYDDGLFPSQLKKEKIKLPVLSDGNIDWKYMESYMRAIENTRFAE